MRLTDEQRMEVEYNRGKHDALVEVGAFLKRKEIARCHFFCREYEEPSYITALLEGRMP